MQTTRWLGSTMYRIHWFHNPFLLIAEGFVLLTIAATHTIAGQWALGAFLLWGIQCNMAGFAYGWNDRLHYDFTHENS